jgi:hypothetical protein
LASGWIIAAALILSLQCAIRLIQQGDVFTGLLGIAAQVVALAVHVKSPRPPVLAALLAAAMVLTGNGVLWDQLLYGEVPWTLTCITAAAAAGFGLTAWMLADLPTSSNRSLPTTRHPLSFRARVLLLFLAGAWLRVSAVQASPDPVIDVYPWLRDAPAYLLQGQNPYATDYGSPYGTERAHRYLVYREPEAQPARYPPLSILASVPFAASGLDARYANVAADLLAAFVLYLAAYLRGSPVIGALAAAIYLNLPRAPFLIEQAWFEPMLAAAIGLGLLLIDRGRPLGFVMLGLGLTGKQFGLILLPPLGKALRSHWLSLLLGIVIVSTVVILPFVIWQPREFFSLVVFKHLHRPLEYQSITLQSAAHDMVGVTIPRLWLWLGGALVIAWITWRTPEQALASSFWVGTTLFVFCLCHTHGHFNYYYLCQYLWLLGIVGLGTCPTGKASGTPGCSEGAEHANAYHYCAAH